MTDDLAGLFHDFRKEGFTQSEASRKVGRSPAWGNALEGGKKRLEVAVFDNIGPEAERALTDFEYFRRRYMGNISTPWQLDAGECLLEYWEMPGKQYVVINVAPGAGKSTLLHDFAAWITVRDRTIRGLFGSRTGRNATKMMRQLRRTLERTTPAMAVERDLNAGVAVDALATLANDFGTFRPEGREDVWKAEEFAVFRPGGDLSARKEPTWSAYGLDGDVLGNRFNFALWDDAVDGKTTNTPEAVEKQRADWDREIENRMEPDGLLAVVGQRISANDLYRYLLDKRAVIDEADQFDRPKYHHIVYPAHFEINCTEAHTKDVAQSWPNGCLLDAYRLPWFTAEGLKQLATNNTTAYEVQYQQHEGDPDAALINKLWITGGRHGTSGEMFPGCYDDNRVLQEPPENIGVPISVATVDPSGTKHWAASWIIGDAANNMHHLVDTFDGKMTANELLEYDPDAGRFTGLMEDWQVRSVAAGYPIGVWIVEVNAAQRYLLQYSHVARWQKKHGVRIIAHTTTKTKLDPTLGPQIMAEPFRSGRVRLPNGDRASKAKVDVVVHQLTNFPTKGVRDDQVHSLWFYFSHLHELMPRKSAPPLLSRPSWLSKAPRARTLSSR